MKPTAATVLPEPVACSNQKRRLAPGSSGASATTSSASSASSQSLASSSSVASSSSSGISPSRSAGSPSASAGSSISAFAVAAALPLPAQGAPLSRSWTSAISAARVPERASS